MLNTICKLVAFNAALLLVINETAGTGVAIGLVAVECVLGAMFWSMGK